MKSKSTALLLLALLPLSQATAQNAGKKAQICLAPASAQVASTNTADALTAVRETFTSFLTGPTLAIVPLTARLASQAREEARQAGCAYVLFPSVKHERKQSGGGVFGKIVSSAAQQGAYSVGGVASSAAGRVAANAVAGAAVEAGRSYATTTRVRDELELSYRLETASGQVMIENSARRKANSDGEDLLTPLVEKAAEAIAAAVAK